MPLRFMIRSGQGLRSFLRLRTAQQLRRWEENIPHLEAAAKLGGVGGAMAGALAGGAAAAVVAGEQMLNSNKSSTGLILEAAVAIPASVAGGGVLGGCAGYAIGVGAGIWAGLVLNYPVAATLVTLASVAATKQTPQRFFKNQASSSVSNKEDHQANATSKKPYK